MKNHEFNFGVEEYLKSYWNNKEKNNLKEYIFLTREMQRHYFVLGKDLKDAEENFMRIDIINRNGFALEHLPVRLEYDEEKCKDWKVDDYWNNNENKEIISV